MGTLNALGHFLRYGPVFVVLNEKVNGQLQGGEYALPIPDFPTGTMRGRFHKQNGQLYVCGMFAWAGNKNGTGGFYRIRYTGETVCLPTTLNASKNKISLQFTENLDPTTAASPASFQLRLGTSSADAIMGHAITTLRIWRSKEQSSCLTDAPLRSLYLI